MAPFDGIANSPVQVPGITGTAVAAEDYVVFAVGSPVPTPPPPPPPPKAPVWSQTPGDGLTYAGLIKSSVVTIKATDPNGEAVHIEWSELPELPVRVQCSTDTSTAATAVATCTLKQTAPDGTGWNTPTPKVVFTATNAAGLTAPEYTMTTATGRYAALGDSFSAGEGNPDYRKGTDDLGTDMCHRSKKSAYAYTVADLPSIGYNSADPSTEENFDFVACSGGTVATMVHGSPSNHEDPQLDEIFSNTTLVTLSAGGNDAGFADILTACSMHYLNLDTEGCLNREYVYDGGKKSTGLSLQDYQKVLIKNLTRTILCPRALDADQSLPSGYDTDRCDDELDKGGLYTVPSLVDFYRQIHDKAPHAQIVVMLYPHLFTDDLDLPTDTAEFSGPNPKLGSPDVRVPKVTVPVPVPIPGGPVSISVGGNTVTFDSKVCDVAAPSIGTFTPVVLTASTMYALNQATDRADAVIAEQVAAAQAEGIDISVADPRPLWSKGGHGGHGQCTDDPWLNTVSATVHFKLAWYLTTPGPGIRDIGPRPESFHPNSKGQAAFGAAALAVLTGATSVPTPILTSSGQTQTASVSGFDGGEKVGAELHSETTDLGTFTADATGTVTVEFSTPAALPSGAHLLLLTGLSSGRSVAVPVTVGEKPTITSGAPPNTTTTGAAYDFAFTAAGSPDPQFSVVDGALPDGLYLDDNGVVSGTPTTAGAATFSITAANTTGAATAGPFTITVAGTNQPPTAGAQSLTGPQDMPIPITLSGTDPEGDTISYTVAGQPGHGTLTGTAPNLTYTPAAGYIGTDSFTFVAKDAQGNSAQATVTITVTAVNHPPTATAQAVTLSQASATTITLTGTDPDGNTLSYRIIDGPTHGTLSGSAPNLTYTPEAGYSGTDSFTFLANDGIVDSAVVRVSITVTAQPAACGTGTPTQDVMVWHDQKAGANQFTAPKVTTAGPNELLLAFIAADGPTDRAQKVAAVTGGALTWTLVSRANKQGGSVEVWQAYAPTKLTAATITAKLGTGGFDGSITIAAFKGSAKKVAAAAGAAGSSGAPSVALTPRTCNGLIWAVGHDWSHPVTAVPVAGQKIQHQFRDTRVRDSFWTQTVLTPTTAGTPIKVSDTSPSDDRWQLVAVEIPGG